MSIDARVLLSCARAEAEAAVGERATSVGPKASLVTTPFRFPGTDADRRELAPWIRKVAKAAGHRDPRGVLVISEETDVRARSYERFVELVGAQGYWCRSDGSFVRATRTDAAEQRPRMATMPPDAPVDARSKLTCFVFPPGAPPLARKPVAFVAMTMLGDGTLLVVVREAFSEPEALLRFFLHYPALAALAKDPRGLLAVPASAYAAAGALASYDEVVRLYAVAGERRGGKPTHYRLRVADLDALRDALER